jgi:hypothetical protein
MIYSWDFAMRGIHELSLGERRVPYGRDHERHFPDRGRDFHLDWNVLKGAALSVGKDDGFADQLGSRLTLLSKEF